MEIVQTSNNPLVVAFESDAEISNMADASAALYFGDICLKHWGLTDMTVQGDEVFLPLTQEETAAFPIGAVMLVIKWFDDNGYTRFADQIPGRVCRWRDKTILSPAAASE